MSISFTSRDLYPPPLLCNVVAPLHSMRKIRRVQIIIVVKCWTCSCRRRALFLKLLLFPSKSPNHDCLVAAANLLYHSELYPPKDYLYPIIRTSGAHVHCTRCSTMYWLRLSARWKILAFFWAIVQQGPASFFRLRIMKIASPVSYHCLIGTENI